MEKHFLESKSEIVNGRQSGKIVKIQHFLSVKSTFLQKEVAKGLISQKFLC